MKYFLKDRRSHERAARHSDMADGEWRWYVRGLDSQRRIAADALATPNEERSERAEEIGWFDSPAEMFNICREYDGLVKDFTIPHDHFPANSEKRSEP